jgi:hypothetical protein
MVILAVEINGQSQIRIDNRNCCAGYRPSELESMKTPPIGQFFTRNEGKIKLIPPNYK